MAHGGAQSTLSPKQWDKFPTRDIVFLPVTGNSTATLSVASVKSFCGLPDSIDQVPTEHNGNLNTFMNPPTCGCQHVDI